MARTFGLFHLNTPSGGATRPGNWMLRVSSALRSARDIVETSSKFPSITSPKDACWQGLGRRKNPAGIFRYASHSKWGVESQVFFLMS